MQPNKPFILLIPIVVAIATGGVCPLASSDPPSTPLDDRSLSAIRGADAQFQQILPQSCQSNGLTALNQVDPDPDGAGTSWYPQTAGCSWTNVGASCGGCTISSYNNLGVPPAAYVNGTGQTAGTQSCGTLQAGTCGYYSPVVGTPGYRCLGIQAYLAPNGQPYTCSDISTLTNQSGGGGGPGGPQ